MTYNPDIHNRKSIRLKNYDYSREGLYFITICSHNKEFKSIFYKHLTKQICQSIYSVW